MGLSVYPACAILLAFSLLPLPARAAYFSGAYLYQLCRVDAKGHEVVPGGAAACEAYIDGVLDYHGVLQSLGIAPRVDICIPKSVTGVQLHAIVLNYLTRNNQHDGFIAAPAVTMALWSTYPCTAGRKNIGR